MKQASCQETDVIWMSLLVGIGPKSCQLSLFFHEEMLSLPFTVTASDNMWFTLLTQNTALIHFDHHYAAQTGFGKPLVDSTFMLALVTGQSVVDVSQRVFANLG